MSVIDVGATRTIPQWNGETAVIEPSKALRWLAATTGGVYVPDNPHSDAVPTLDPYPLRPSRDRGAAARLLGDVASAGRRGRSALSVTVTRPETIVLAPSLLDAPPVELSASLLSRVRDFEKC